jgi:hypothetical protein
MTLTRREFAQSIGVGAGSLTLLSQAACPGGVTEITTALDLAVAAVSTAIGIAFPQYAPLVGPYLSDVTNVFDYALTELASTDSAETKADDILQKIMAIVIPQLPSGTPQTIVTDIGLVGADVLKFIAAIQAMKTTITSTAAGRAAIKVKGKKALQLSRGDQNKLPLIALANAKNKVRLQAAGINR